MAAKVHIVGAGPGDPELITVKALKRIQAADVILYDRLVNDELLAHAKPGALLLYCGKAPGRHAMPQDAINELLIRYAKEGQTVVRLKGGDPFIFGRGGEEALALAACGIPYEIVPGITSAIGAAAAADIPLTHRGVAASFACVTGNRCHGDQMPVRWDLLAHGVDTLVVYMGVSQLRHIQQELLKHGKSGSTPAALVEKGTTERQRVLTGKLQDIDRIAAAAGLENPAVIIIGEAVGVSGQLERLSRTAESMIS